MDQGHFTIAPDFMTSIYISKHQTMGKVGPLDKLQTGHSVILCAMLGLYEMFFFLIKTYGMPIGHYLLNFNFKYYQIEI